jgi:hypothetical protein
MEIVDMEKTFKEDSEILKQESGLDIDKIKQDIIDYCAVCGYHRLSLIVKTQTFSVEELLWLWNNFRKYLFDIGK